MVAFSYIALDSKGRQKKGVEEADSAKLVRIQLREQGLSLLSVDEATARMKLSLFYRFKPHFNTTDLALVTRQLSTLTEAGISIEESLKIIADQHSALHVKTVLLSLRTKIMEGYSFADSLDEFPRIFPRVFRSTVAAGEQTGKLEHILTRLADYIEASQQAKQKIMLALLYPMILSVTSMIIVIFLLGYVVPDVIKIFDDTGQELPLLTKGLIAVSGIIESYALWVFFALFGGIIFLKNALNSPIKTYKICHFILHIPIIGKIVKAVNIARFSSTLTILVSSNVPLVEGLRIAANVISNVVLRQSIGQAVVLVEEGKSLFTALKEEGHFSPMFLQMIASGESSGELEKMLTKVSTMQERELAHKVALFVGIFEPVILLIMGGIVLLLVLAILLPILNINQLVG